jgi:hypothetical protein
MLIGPLRVSAYSSAIAALPRSVLASVLSVRGALHLVDGPDLQVVLQVLADARQFVLHRYAQRLQQAGRSDAGQLQDLRRPDGPGTQHHLAARASHDAVARRARPRPRCSAARRRSPRSNSSRATCAFVHSVKLGRAHRRGSQEGLGSVPAPAASG